MFICGTGSFSHQEEDETYINPIKKTRKSTSFCKIIGKDNKTNKNPFADRGLDKFYDLLAKHDEKRQQIYMQMGSQDISFVRFVYSNDSKHAKPIVVKVKDTKNQEKNNPIIIANPPNHEKNMDETMKTSSSIIDAEDQEVSQPDRKRQKKRYCQKCAENFKVAINSRQPFDYFVMIVILILLYLAVFGRSFAILCTSVGWYLIPSITRRASNSSLNDHSNPRKLKRKKELIEKKIVNHSDDEGSQGSSSPTSVINGLSSVDYKLGREKFDHRRRW